MRITFYSVAESFGGGERYLAMLVPALRERGVEAGVVCGSARAPRQLAEFADRGDGSSANDVVVLNGVGSLYRWGRDLPDCRASLFIQHSLLSDHQTSVVKRWLRPMLVRHYARQISAVVRVCRAAIPDGFFPHIETVYNGVPFDASHRPRRRQTSEFVLAMVGTVNANKGQADAIRLLRTLPEHVRLRIIGDGPLRERLQQRCGELGAGARVEWTGFVENPAEPLSVCDALLMLSRDEAMPFAALEAMALGLPVISTAVGGMPELVRDGYNGYLVKRRDDGQLLDRIQRLDADEELRYALAEHAHATIGCDFSTESMVSGFLRVCEDALRRTPAHR